MGSFLHLQYYSSKAAAAMYLHVTATVSTASSIGKIRWVVLVSAEVLALASSSISLMATIGLVVTLTLALTVGQQPACLSTAFDASTLHWYRLECRLSCYLLSSLKLFCIASGP